MKGTTRAMTTGCSATSASRAQQVFIWAVGSQIAARKNLSGYCFTQSSTPGWGAWTEMLSTARSTPAASIWAIKASGVNSARKSSPALK